MLAILRQVLVKPLNIIGILCMLVLVLFHKPTSMYYYLTIAQLVYVPIMLQQLVQLKRWQFGAILVGQMAVTLLYFIDSPILSIIGASTYLISTVAVMWSGIERFLQRGFVNTAEIMIDIGLIYIAMGGIWFFAHVTGIDTGFSPIITWLTAIHFHYSAFLLCITVGLLGRLHMSTFYASCSVVIAAGPMLVALGITFSHMIEIVSVSLYVVAIFSLAVYALRVHLPRLAGAFIRLAFLTLCFTIVWSFLYAYSNVTGSGLVNIPDMLAFHGILNCILFGGAITLAWIFYIPPSNHQPYTFPVSQIRGKITATTGQYHALVDDMDVFINKDLIAPRIYDFYENTLHYELFASVQWSTWFKPFAFLYQFMSRRIGQLNLPYSADVIKMDGDILKVDANIDGRMNPRIWQRSANGQTIFSAIYSVHTNNNHTYMNIALPLPKSVMHGILTVVVKDDSLYLTSDANGDAGTYLSIGRFIFKLPLHEYFTIEEQDHKLYATHEMTLFGVKFLHIDYTIHNTTLPFNNFE